MQSSFRDFLYMDVERLKSIVAQLNEGLTETINKTTTESDQDKINLGASLLKMIKVGGENTYLFQNQSSESQTLHDSIYNLAEKLLLKENSLINISKESDIETLNINLTSFILVKGKTFINDYIYMKRLLDNFEDINKAIISSDIFNNPEYASLSEKEKNRIIGQQVKESNISKELKQSLLTFINNFYNERIVFKSVPSVENPEFRFVGTLNKEYLRENIEDIIFKYGTAPQEEWYMFAQVASIPHGQREHIDISSGTNEIEQGLQLFFDALREMEVAGLSISFPEIAVTPIAIYRQ
ncbi:DUF6414 family protein [Priestia megaterium]|uniref:DUF6414 family protein n=1 Tax=Priestia megaterium TaxID=1404 RepID=UPI003AFB0429